MRTVKCL